MRQIFAILFALTAVGFTASLPAAPYAGSFAVKVLPIVLLFAAAVAARPFRGKFALCAAIVFSGAGDVILDLSFEGSFIFGLAAFLIAHLWYIGLFGLDIAWNKLRPLATLPAILYPAGMAVFLWPHLGGLKIPVAVYVAVIATMLVFAINRRSAGKSVLFGAIFFLASDSILAINKFYSPQPWARYAIMATYYLAQYLIVTGILREKNSQ